ncbi:MAG: hypothetical protein ACD_5C00228G0005 [uncultured bacterium]|nr:MAG: hypothetical protein ACD_5C00228G0005 [uncultured bacterium]
MHFINVAQAGVISQAPSVSTLAMNVLNFLLSVVGIIAIMALVVSGIMYFNSFGDTKQMEGAKKYVQASILGIVLAMGGMILIRLIGKFFSAQ